MPSDHQIPPTATAKATPAVGDVSAAAPSFPIVGIGASAGGLAAFEAFFAGMPADEDPGMAFVLVQHLAPDHKSVLAELLQRYTRMPVSEVEDGVVLEPNCIYVIPPARDLALINGSLHLLDPSAPRGLRLPIDFFFKSLAQDQHERAVGIILSGTGSDGSQGVRAIKGEGGMIMAQTPASTEFDGMPRSALATCLVDYELLPRDMPAQLIAYAKHALGKLPKTSGVSSPSNENSLRKIFLLLRSQTGHDFSLYKRNTICRRIERRMAVHQVTDLESFVQLLQQTPSEVQALFRDLLIGVTNFFRDPEAFKALEHNFIPKLFEDKSPTAAIRVWVAGCSTGEEAYSIAILLKERVETLKQSFVVQIFATDIDSQAIAAARTGVFPASIAADMSPDRLARFFTADTGAHSYRIRKDVRDMIVFSEQDVIKDPPFSKLDLICCRNLLIYLSIHLQRKLIPLFHYALSPGGILFLGSSEGIGDYDQLFDVLDRKAKLYKQKALPLTHLTRTSRGSFVPPLTPIDPLELQPHAAGRILKRMSLRELMEQTLMREVVPAGALVSENGDILYLHGRTGKYLELAPGEPGTNILKMARDGLRTDLAMTLHQATRTKAIARVSHVNVKTNDQYARINVTVLPATSDTDSATEPQLFVVIFDEATHGVCEPSQPNAAATSATLGQLDQAQVMTDTDARVAELKNELRAKEEYLRATNEELETSSEELKSANEEMQSVNEELQSTNEELETSKEELQSVNEELATVNSELQTKVSDLSRANNDMNNLLAGTGIGTVFVDHQLRILRFTPAASAIINLIPSDVGRPVAHIVSNLAGYNSLVPDVQGVLDTLVAKDVEVSTLDGKSFNMRIQPYRTLDHVIEGAVISFMDITLLVRTRTALAKANEAQRLAIVVRDSLDAICVHDLMGRIIAWNPGAQRLYGWSEAEAQLMNMRDRIPQGLREGAMTTLTQTSQSDSLQPQMTKRLTKQGSVIEVSVISSALLNEAGELYAIATTERSTRGANS
ncbi:MAG: PAS domain-containing protein [Proteobacteria bacterium]|nr:PAS domain-containing protein [Pseudomonadota bacterium]